MGQHSLLPATPPYPPKSPSEGAANHPSQRFGNGFVDIYSDEAYDAHPRRHVLKPGLSLKCVTQSWLKGGETESERARGRGGAREGVWCVRLCAMRFDFRVQASTVLNLAVEGRQNHRKHTKALHGQYSGTRPMTVA